MNHARRLLLCVVLLALGLRLFQLGVGSVQVDEAMSVLAAAQWRSNPHFDVHPPFYPAALAAWAQVTLAEWWLRLFSVLPSVGCVALFWPLARRLGLTAAQALGGSLLLAVSFADMQQAREIRMYAWLTLWAATHLLALLGRRWAWAFVSLLAACYTHLFGFFLIPLGWLLVRARGTFLMQTGVVLAWLPWAIPQALAHKDHLFELRHSPSWQALVEAVGRLVGGRIAAFGDPWSLLFGAVALGWLAWRRPRVHAVLYVWAMLPWLALWLLSALTPVQLFEFKYLVWTLPAWVALLMTSARIEVLVLLWTVVNLVGALPWLLSPHRWMADWRGVARFATAHRLPTVVHPSMMSAPLLYYGVRAQGVDVWEQVKPEQPMLWVTTPNHPYVSSKRLLTGVGMYWRKTSERSFATLLPSTEVDVSAWEWVGPQALRQRRENGGSP
jgi:hypothetical protein